MTDVLTRQPESVVPHAVGDWARERTSPLDLSDVAALALTAVTATAV